jgi:hypothetical protein
MTFSKKTLSTTKVPYAECLYAECHDFLIVMLNVIMLNIIMLNVVAPIFVVFLRLVCCRNVGHLNNNNFVKLLLN